jgi:hypothetical protein
VEFIDDQEVFDLLGEYGIKPADAEGELVRLRMASSDDVVRLHLTTGETDAEPDDGSEVITMDSEALPAAIDSIVHKLHLHQVLLIPFGKWRNVFDAVAFSLAQNEDWQEFETTATVELNGRDPLLCEPGDFQTISALMRALLSDAESADQGLMLTTTAAPLLLEVIPSGLVKVHLGNQAMADEVAEALAH